MKSFFNKSGLTKQELIVIGFLLITFAAGLIVKYSGWKNPEEYDYLDTDKRFEEQVKSAFTELKENKLSEEQQDKANELKRFSDSLLTQKESSSLSQTKFPDKKININLAYVPDLQLLPGIGEVIAERIIEYREQKGGFKKVEDIKKIKGIGDKKFEQIKDYITVE